MEVELATRVLDGCVVLIDAVAGVQCQTKSVWKRISSRRLPAIAFVNKMDRDGADLVRSIQSLQQDLGTNPVALQFPVFEDGSFLGTVDLLTSQVMTYIPDESRRSQSAEDLQCVVTPLTASHPLYEEVQASRKHLFEAIAEADDEFLSAFLDKNIEDITIKESLPALRRQSLLLYRLFASILHVS